MSIIDGIKLPNGNTYNITIPLLSSGFTTTAGSSTSGSYLAAKWSVTDVNGITTPVDGMTVAVRVPLAGNSGGILLSIDNKKTYYPIVRNVNTLVTTQYAVGSTLVLTFNSTQTASPYTSSGVASTVTGCWQIADYDANTKNSAGTSNKTGTKMYLVGATSQTSSGTTTYTNTNCYIGTDNYLYSKGGKVDPIALENQNAFSNVKVGSTTIAADTTTDTLEVVAGSNITLTPDATNDKITIAATNTTYSDATTSAAGLMSAADKTKLNGIATGANAYTLPAATSSTLGGVKIGSNISVSSGTISVPVGDKDTAGVTIVYPAASCTTFSSDSGTITPLAAQKAAKMFAVPRITSTDKAIARFDGTDGEIQNSKIIIEDVTNTRDTNRKAQVIAIPAENDKKMVYGYCTDQVDGTSFIGGIFDKTATAYPYTAGLAIGGSSGNLLWKGNKVIDTTSTELTSKAPLASPTFTGTPKAPTAAAGTNTTQIATTAFVQSAISSSSSSDILNKHVWFRIPYENKVPVVSSSYTKVTLSDTSSKGSLNGSVERNGYTEISVNAAGELCGKGTQSDCRTYYNLTADQIKANHLNKYFQAGDEDTWYFVDSGSTASYDTGGKGYRTFITAKAVSIADNTVSGNIEYVTSSSSSTYPASGQSGGYEYYYLGTPKDFLIDKNMRIEYGSYTGTGHNPIDQAVELSFNHRPLLIAITSDGDQPRVYLAGQTQGSYTYGRLLWKENKVYLYVEGTTSDTAHNVSGTVYRYVSVGY